MDLLTRNTMRYSFHSLMILIALVCVHGCDQDKSSSQELTSYTTSRSAGDYLWIIQWGEVHDGECVFVVFTKYSHSDQNSKSGPVITRSDSRGNDLAKLQINDTKTVNLYPRPDTGCLILEFDGNDLSEKEMIVTGDQLRGFINGSHKRFGMDEFIKYCNNNTTSSKKLNKEQ